jgi:hypothetical protein
MGIEHRYKDESEELVMRCPKCEVISVAKEEFPQEYVSLFAGHHGNYFICQNPKCNVERIYGENCVITGK